MRSTVLRPALLAPAVLAVLLAVACTASDRGEPRSPAAEPAPGISGAGGRTSAPGSAVLAGLRRPWAHPAVPAGKGCPVTTVLSRPDPELGPLLGRGPARPAAFGRNAVLDYLAPDERTDWTDRSWGGQKVLWAVDPVQTGPVLVRGRRLDEPGVLAFEDPAISELVLNTDSYQGRAGGWKDYPSFTRVRVPGCYAYQIDTAAGTWTVIFLARGPSV
jgi:hypothetical protein